MVGLGTGGLAVRRALLWIVPVVALVIPPVGEARAASGCRSDPMANVYRPSRLKILSARTTVHGVIKSASRQSDGDYQIGMRLDSGQTLRIEIVPADQPACVTGAKV